MVKKQAWKEKRGQQWGRIVIMLLAGLASVIVIFLAGHLKDHPFWKSGVEHFGTAILIAAFLGLTIHIWLEKQLTEDVFAAAMGYELPDELKDEIREVYGNRILCENHSQSVQIDDLGNGFVSITIGVERKFINIGQTAQQFPISLGIDEWGVAGHPSEFIEIAYERDGNRTTLFPSGDIKIVERPEGNLAKARSDLTLKSKDTVTVFVKCSETRPVNGEHFFHYSYATLKPRVSVNAPAFDWFVSFSHRDEPHRERYSNTVTLNGLLLPHQNIRVRWWPKSSTHPPPENA